MGREDIPWIAAVVALLLAGFVIGQRVSLPLESTDPAIKTANGRLFRPWFWEHRSLDLAVQVCLIFVGALGIAALLPPSREDDVK
jgi:hypothetical protein